LGVTAAREGDLEQALIMGERALEGERQSMPSLIMTSRELAAEMRRHYASEPAAQGYLARLRDLGQSVPGFLPPVTCHERPRPCDPWQLDPLKARRLPSAPAVRWQFSVGVT
jgi:hypothetical protein